MLDAFARHAPEIVIHMAAQSLVRRSFADPRATYETNVMGTVNVLEAVRATASVRAVVNVTSDKCYDNFAAREPRPFVEDDPKGGHDPYSNSKACAELVADAYLRSFFAPDDGREPRLASARAGNVIGGGDWGADRLIPDIMAGALDGAPIPIRNPDAVRPWQHVLNPLVGLPAPRRGAARLTRAPGRLELRPRARRRAPRALDRRPADRAVARRAALGASTAGPHPHEAHFLALDSTKAREQLGWAPVWELDETLAQIVAWYRALGDGEDMRDVTLGQIDGVRERPGTLAGKPRPAAERLEVRARHEPDELLEARLRLPAELRLGLRRVADQLVDLGGAQERRVDAHVALPVVDARPRRRRSGRSRARCASCSSR